MVERPEPHEAFGDEMTEMDVVEETSEDVAAGGGFDRVPVDGVRRRGALFAMRDVDGGERTESSIAEMRATIEPAGPVLRWLLDGRQRQHAGIGDDFDRRARSFISGH